MVWFSSCLSPSESLVGDIVRRAGSPGGIGVNVETPRRRDPDETITQILLFESDGYDCHFSTEAPLWQTSEIAASPLTLRGFTPVLNVGPPPGPSAPRGYRFEQVEIDLCERTVRVDGSLRQCPPKAFELLAALCGSPGKVLGRSDLIDLLWPGGQVVSDEALTQAVFRARNALGPYAGVISTVRGVGIRLGAEAVPLETAGRSGAGTPTAPRAEAQARTVSKAPSEARLHWLAAVAAAVAALAITWAVRLIGPAPDQNLVVDAGYGLMAESVLAANRETTSRIAEALLNEGRGEQARAETLLETIHGEDSTTPIPALFLAMWAGGRGDLGRADTWLAQADARIGDRQDAYLALFFDYVTASSRGTPEDVIRVAGAMLDIRPEAWRMHHARAHLMEYLGMREAALKEISRIPVHAFGDRKLEMTIADRASMGDVDGAQAILDRLGPSGDPSAFEFISGRVAWSRGDFDAAHAHFLGAAGRAYDLARIDLYRRSLIYAAAIDVAGGREAEAINRLEQARSAIERRSLIDETDTTLFLAQLHAAAGRTDHARAELERVLSKPPQDMPTGMKNAAALTTLRLAPESANRLPALPDESARALVRAHESLGRGDADAAAQALDDARNAGAFKGRLADEARWLEFQLGLPVTAEKPLDPPYPPLSRVVLRRELRASLAETGHDPGPPRP